MVKIASARDRSMARTKKVGFSHDFIGAPDIIPGFPVLCRLTIQLKNYPSMRCFLKKRATQLQELQDAPDCNEALLHNTYVHFKTLNRLVSSWRSLYKLYIKPLLKKENKTLTLLDVGCGGGDITLALAKWAKKDGLALEITAIDTDSRAIDFVKKLNSPDNIRFKHASTKDLIAQNKSFDLVISNHLIHHLSGSELRKILAEVEQLAKKLVIFNDIERSDLAYFGFTALGILIKPFFPNSFIWVDGPRSIKRSHSKQELMAIAPANWQVKCLLPFRLLLIREFDEVKRLNPQPATTVNSPHRTHVSQ